MKSTRWMLGGLAAALALVVVVGAPQTARSEDAKKKEFGADKGSATIDAATFPEDQQAYYKIFAQKCSKCHTLARPINTDMKVSAWKRYVKKMMNKPDSGISPASGKKIYKFLKFWQKKKDAAKKAREAKGDK